jgi:hypothetical protein
MWGRHVTAETTIDEIRRLVDRRRFETEITQLLNQEKTWFLVGVAEHVLSLLEKMKLEPDPGLVASLQTEVWGMSGYRAQRGMTKQEVMRQVDQACYDGLEGDLVFWVKERLLEEALLTKPDDQGDEPDDQGDLALLVGPKPAELRLLEAEEEGGDWAPPFEEDVAPPAIRVHSGDCHCGKRVLAQVSALEGGDEVTFARAGVEGRPAMLSYTRLSEQDYLGVNASMLA